MRVFKITLRAYNGFYKEILPSTTIAGGITYAAYLNKDILQTTIGFTDFHRNSNIYKLYVSRIKLDKIVNKAEPFYLYKYVDKGEYYLTYIGYAIANEENEVKNLINKYGAYIGNWNTVFSLDSILEVSNISDKCVYNLPVIDLSDLISKYKNMRVQVHRFTNSNYLNMSPYKIYYDTREKKFLKVTNKKYVYLATFKIDNADIGYYYDESVLANLNPFERIYVKMGFGVIGPCIQI